MLRLRVILAGILLAVPFAIARSQSWIFESGKYTHDPEKGTRVAQFEDLPTVERIPYREYFSEDGPDPFGMNYWGGDSNWYQGPYDFNGIGWDTFPRMPYSYPLLVP